MGSDSDFFFAEVANVFWKRVNREEDSVDDAKVVLEAIRAQRLQVHLSLELISRTFDMAIRTRRAIYDCVYLTLAVEYRCPMVTADEKLFNALQQNPLAAYLCWVEDVP